MSVESITLRVVCDAKDCDSEFTTPHVYVSNEKIYSEIICEILPDSPDLGWTSDGCSRKHIPGSTKHYCPKHKAPK